ncbi:Thioredoxin-like incomplete domain containing protein [Pandoravirus dulcis]|uniref:Thioredoxin-like incomplete domain containing protein n=1 Tax=Pandoravirus dulcis TaxID=1349409 RepID=S4VT42_9VIRU|nr:Thioredoxin-like incomplete domain containing protein [Pandoravirus dulcis]AGO82570.1 Thioredoxin-like incomplete domain containing protein [Pandoravirus dulcis]
MTTPHRDDAATATGKLDPTVQVLIDAFTALGASAQQNAPVGAHVAVALASIAQVASSSALDGSTRPAPLLDNLVPVVDGMMRYLEDQSGETLAETIIRSAPIALDLLERMGRPHGLGPVTGGRPAPLSLGAASFAEGAQPIPHEERTEAVLPAPDSPTASSLCTSNPEPHVVSATATSRQKEAVLDLGAVSQREPIVDHIIAVSQTQGDLNTHQDTQAQRTATVDAAPTAASPGTLVEPQTALATLPAFVAAIEALPAGFIISAGADGVRPVHAESALRVSDLAANDDACRPMTLAHTVITYCAGAECNAVQLLGGPVEARLVARSLAERAATHPHAVVMIGRSVVLLPFAPPTVDLWARSVPVSATRLNIASLPANRQKIAEAALAVRQSAGLGAVLAILSDLQVDPSAAPVDFYRVGDRLMSASDLEEAYPRMGRQVRDVLFCPATPLSAGSGDARDPKVALYATPLAASVLDAAYGPGDDCLAIARRLMEGAAPAVASVPAADPDAATPKTHAGRVRYDLDFEAANRLCRDSGGGLVVLTMAWCHPCFQVMSSVNEAAARLDVPVVVVDREKIPPACRPSGYPHIYAVSRDDQVCVYSGDRNAADLVEFVCGAVGSRALRN